MTKYILKRVGYSIVTLFLLVAITFFMMQLLPGDPFTGDKQLPAAQMEALYAKYGLDKPVWQQFFIYIGNVVQGDLGISLTYNRAVTLMITEAFAISFDVVSVPFASPSSAAYSSAHSQPSSAARQPTQLP